jgi:hypothetical protein
LVEEDLVPYPSLAMEFLGFTLDRDTLAIKDKIVPQGRAKEQHKMQTLPRLMLLQVWMALQSLAPTMTKSNTITTTTTS